jgi:hypothetical protein
MDVVIIFNGLGNQMSQYAFYLQKKSINKSTYLISFCKDHNGLELETVFSVNTKETLIQKLLYILFRILLTDRLKIVSGPLKWILNLFKCKIVRESFNYNYNPEFLKPSEGITFYYGGWHAEKYFVKENQQIKSVFEFTGGLGISNEEHVTDIASTNSVSVHVRRGDFMNEANIGLFGGVSTKAYFEEAIKLMVTKVDDLHFFVFSNDMDWVKENLSMDTVTYVTCNSGKDSWKDMCLMSLCQHNIIPNSTFSWWGAWLNKNPYKIVVCPSRFLNNDTYTDIYPDSWVKISDY